MNNLPAIFLAQYIFFIVLVNFIIVTSGAVCYVFRSLGVMGMMKKFGMDRPGMAFIPFYGDYLFGKVAEESSLRINGKKPLPFGKIILCGKVVGGGLSVVCSVLGTVLSSLLTAAGVPDGGAAAASTVIIVFVVIIWCVALIANVAAIALTIFEYIALYKVYSCFAPKNAVLFTVLSIVVSVTTSFILFSIRNNDPLSPVIDDFDQESADTQ